MTHDDVQRWLDRYLEAWRANERGPIEALFTEDVVYRFRPNPGYPEAHGIDAVVDAWLGDSMDEPDAWDASYEPFAVDGDRCVAVGWSRYHATDTEAEKTYRNAFLLRFAADGRCVEFTEFFMLDSPERASAAPTTA